MLETDPADSISRPSVASVRMATSADDGRRGSELLTPNDELPFWLRSCIGLSYAAVGAAHLIVGALIGAAEKPLILGAVIVLLLLNILTLDMWRARLSVWWHAGNGKS